MMIGVVKFGVFFCDIILILLFCFGGVIIGFLGIDSCVLLVGIGIFGLKR